MFEIFHAGGPLMWLILACSIVALTIIIERMIILRKKRVLSSSLLPHIKGLIKQNKLTPSKVELVEQHSPLGVVFAAGLRCRRESSQVITKALEDAGKRVVHQLNRYLNTLGTIASITPLLGLLGTVIGMIKVFTDITAHGVGDPAILSDGISQALITTAAGLSVGIPCMMLVRYFKSRIIDLTLSLEESADKLLETLQKKQL